LHELAISVFHELDVEELWMAYGTGTNKKFMLTHEISASLGLFKARVQVFHSLTGYAKPLHSNTKEKRQHGIHEMLFLI